MSDPTPTSVDSPAVVLAGVGVRIDGRKVLRDVDWVIERAERWVVLGPNGSGKTTLVRVASLLLHPSAGEVTVLGARLGRTDLRALRGRIGIVSAAVERSLRAGITAVDVVACGLHGALEPWWHTYTEADHRRAVELLDLTGVARFAQHTFGTLSSGERQRVMLARALMSDPGLLLLDEPAAGLDIAGREGLVTLLAELAASPDTPPMVLVTHHVEEIPTGFDHALLLSDGRVHASGPIGATLDSATLSSCFGIDLDLRHDAGRWSARAAS